MDDVPRGQAVALGDLGVAGLAAVQRAALFQKLRAGRAMDRAIDAAAAQQAFVGGVDDRIDVEPGDVAFDDLEAAMAYQ